MTPTMKERGFRKRGRSYLRVDDLGNVAWVEVRSVQVGSDLEAFHVTYFLTPFVWREWLRYVVDPSAWPFREGDPGDRCLTESAACWKQIRLNPSDAGAATEFFDMWTFSETNRATRGAGLRAGVEWMLARIDAFWATDALVRSVLPVDGLLAGAVMQSNDGPSERLEEMLRLAAERNRGHYPATYEAIEWIRERAQRVAAERAMPSPSDPGSGPRHG